MTKLETLRNKLINAQAEVELLRIKISDAESELVRKVQVKNNKSSSVLMYNGRKLNVTYNSRGRPLIKENGKTINYDYVFGMRSLCVNMVEGKI
jgi:hypothetical protein